jgi:hypothetical protein
LAVFLFLCRVKRLPAESNNNQQKRRTFMTRKRVFKPMLALLMAFAALLCASSAFAGSMPEVSGISGVSGDFERDPSVTMNGTRVSAQRYTVSINGVSYEAYCTDPGIRGPENAGAVYELSGEANPRLSI